MKTEQNQNQIRSRLSARPEQLSNETNAEANQKSYSLLPTPSVSEGLKTTPTGRPAARSFPVEGRKTETEQQSTKKRP
jgi:hypothetical protein